MHVLSVTKTAVNGSLFRAAQRFTGLHKGKNDKVTLQYVPGNMHTVCAIYWLSDAVACSSLQGMGRVWVYARQYASDIC